MTFPELAPDQFTVAVISDFSLKDRTKSQLTNAQGGAQAPPPTKVSITETSSSCPGSEISPHPGSQYQY